MAYPLIGLTCYRTIKPKNRPAVGLTETYLKSVLQAGGAPVVIPLGIGAETVAQIVSRLDGVLFTGGGDIHPERYGSQWHPQVDEVDTDRDEVEVQLLREVIAQRKPFLGICRGIQLINVALGGTLYEDIADQRPNSIRHPCWPGPRDFLAHTVRLERGSLLQQLTGQAELQVNSLHHQGLRQVAPGLRVTALASDGLVEGIEYADRPFGLGVQWHPEELQQYAPMRALFTAFVDAARR